MVSKHFKNSSRVKSCSFLFLLAFTNVKNLNSILKHQSRLIVDPLSQSPYQLVFNYGKDVYNCFYQYYLGMIYMESVSTGLTPYEMSKSRRTLPLKFSRTVQVPADTLKQLCNNQYNYVSLSKMPIIKEVTNGKSLSQNPLCLFLWNGRLTMPSSFVTVFSFRQ